MKTFTLLSLLAVMALGVMVFVGCETESADAPIYISPANASVREGESVTFTAEGGYDYRWTISESSLGRLSSSTGQSTVYTSISSEAGTQTLTLTSTINGASAGSAVGTSNSIAYKQSSEVTINHIGTEAPTADSVSIQPASATTSVGNATVNFLAVGNGSNYKWTRSNSALGTLSSSSGSSTIYTANIPGTQTITLTYNAPDGTAKSKTATVTQN